MDSFDCNIGTRLWRWDDNNPQWKFHHRALEMSLAPALRNWIKVHDKSKRQEWQLRPETREAIAPCWHREKEVLHFVTYDEVESDKRTHDDLLSSKSVMFCPQHRRVFLKTYPEEEYHLRYVHDMGMVNSWKVLEHDCVSAKS